MKFKFLLLALLFSVYANSKISLPKVISSNMVFQMDKPVPVWGGADAGKVVTVEFAGQKKTAVSDNNGKWIVTLDAMKAGFTPLDLKISTSDFDTTLTNILIGEVWLCGGQ